MNKVIIKQGEQIYIDNCDIKYILYADTPIFINDKVYFSNGDNFFHLYNNRSTELLQIFYDIKNLLGFCCVNIKNSYNNDDKLYIEIPKDTIIKMNNLPVSLGCNMTFYIKPETKFIIPEYSNLEILSKNNIIKIINKDEIDCFYSKIL